MSAPTLDAYAVRLQPYRDHRAREQDHRGCPPNSPFVQVTRMTRAPSFEYRAIIPPVDEASSSGCAWTRTMVGRC